MARPLSALSEFPGLKPKFGAAERAVYLHLFYYLSLRRCLRARVSVVKAGQGVSE